MLSSSRGARSFSVEGGEFDLAIAETDAQDVVAARQHVERGGFFGDLYGVEQREDQDVGADLHALGVWGEVGHHRNDLQHLQRAGEEMVREP
jgi:hypothetical protein